MTGSVPPPSGSTRFLSPARVVTGEAMVVG